MQLSYDLRRAIDAIRRGSGLVDFFHCVYCEALIRIWNPLILKSWSAEDEDRVADRLLGYKPDGFYIDIGCMSPAMGNNTYRFYRRGWKGIAVDANADLIAQFQHKRPRDISLHFGVGDKPDHLDFYSMFPDSLSTFSIERAEECKKEGFRVLSVARVEVKTLAWIYENYAAGQDVDFLSVDVEGYDYQVLAGNNWQLCRPRVICVESADDSVNRLLAAKGYSQVCRRMNTIWLDDSRAHNRS